MDTIELTHGCWSSFLLKAYWLVSSQIWYLCTESTTELMAILRSTEKTMDITGLSTSSAVCSPQFCHQLHFDMTMGLFKCYGLFGTLPLRMIMPTGETKTNLGILEGLNTCWILRRRCKRQRGPLVLWSQCWKPHNSCAASYHQDRDILDWGYWVSIKEVLIDYVVLDANDTCWCHTCPLVFIVYYILYILYCLFPHGKRCMSHVHSANIALRIVLKTISIPSSVYLKM